MLVLNTVLQGLLLAIDIARRVGICAVSHEICFCLASIAIVSFAVC